MRVASDHPRHGFSRFVPNWPIWHALPVRNLRGRPPLRLLMAAVALLAALSGTSNLNELETIKARGKLVMLTINGATTYYLGPGGEAGFEHDLARRFAAYLGLPLEIVVADSIDALIPNLEHGTGDFIAANLSRAVDRQRLLRFGPVFDEVRPVVVYRRGSRRPQTPEDLVGGRLEIIEGTSYPAFLEPLRDRIGLDWSVRANASIEDLLEAVSREDIDYTILDSNILELNRRYFPSVGAGFSFDDSQRLAWATRLSDDDSLTQAMREFFHRPATGRALEALRERYFAHVENYEPVGTLTFMRQMRGRLPKVRPLFEQVAAEADMDWRLLAAISYQESHWNPDAESYTGVRGLMMLTRATARQLGIKDRTDPLQSVQGGAQYLQSILERLPERIEFPDRLWLGLAAYNIGFGHVEDARILTERQGGNPDRWIDVRDRLPLLTQQRYFSQTRFGYARGYEAFNYVENIRTFHEILVWMEGREHPLITSNGTTVEAEPVSESG